MEILTLTYDYFHKISKVALFNTRRMLAGSGATELQTLSEDIEKTFVNTVFPSPCVETCFCSKLFHL